MMKTKPQSMRMERDVPDHEEVRNAGNSKTTKRLKLTAYQHNILCRIWLDENRASNSNLSVLCPIKAA